MSSNQGIVMSEFDWLRKFDANYGQHIRREYNKALDSLDKDWSNRITGKVSGLNYYSQFFPDSSTFKYSANCAMNLIILKASEGIFGWFLGKPIGLAASTAFSAVIGNAKEESTFNSLKVWQESIEKKVKDFEKGDPLKRYYMWAATGIATTKINYMLCLICTRGFSGITGNNSAANLLGILASSYIMGRALSYEWNLEHGKKADTMSIAHLLFSGWYEGKLGARNL